MGFFCILFVLLFLLFFLFVFVVVFRGGGLGVRVRGFICHSRVKRGGGGLHSWLFLWYTCCFRFSSSGNSWGLLFLKC